MPDLSQIRSFPLKVIFIVHFLFMSLSLLGYWSTGSYMFYNGILIITLLWAIREQNSEEPIQLAIAVNGFAIILDIFILVMCFPDSHSARERFSAAMAILHLIVRPFTTIYLSKIHGDRTGTEGVLGGIIGNNRNQSSYEDIDRSGQAPPPPPHYDFATAQQI